VQRLSQGSLRFPGRCEADAEYRESFCGLLNKVKKIFEVEKISFVWQVRALHECPLMR
jgi:hypothetical protein